MKGYYSSMTGLVVVGAMVVTASNAMADGPRIARAPIPAPTQSWAGFYVGGHVGYAWSGNPLLSKSDTTLLGLAVGPSFFKTIGIDERDSGVLGGLQIGHNWQFAPTWLVGIEGDWSWAGLKPGGSAGPLVEFDNTVAVGSSTTLHTDVRGIGSIRGRFGYTQPSWMVYATGGWAVARLGYTGNLFCPNGVCSGDSHAPVRGSSTRSGWVVGSGVEFKQPNSPWVLGFEYLYYNSLVRSSHDPYRSASRSDRCTYPDE